MEAVERLNMSPASRPAAGVAAPAARPGRGLSPAAWALLAVGLACVLAPWLSPFGPEVLDLHNRLSPPSWTHPMGTDALGRDLLTRTLHGGRTSLALAVAASLIGLGIGTLVGALAGALRGRVDALLMGGVDLALSVPGFFLALLAGYRFGGGRLVLCLTLGALFWMEVARLVRARFLGLQQRQFVAAARAAGASPLRLVSRHLLPNVAGTLQAAGVLILARTVHAEAALSFLGFGVRPPAPSWGNLLADARHYVGVAPWLVLGPGLFLFLTLWSVHGLRLRGDSA